MSTATSWLGKSSTPTFGNISLTKTITDIIVVWKLNQKRLKKSLFYPKVSKIIFKSNLYLMSIFHRGQVTPSSPFFPNTNLTKTIGNLLVVSNVTKIWL